MVKMRELNEYQQIYLQTIFDFFYKEGKWPTYGYVERYIERTVVPSHPDFDMDAISKSLPGGFATGFGWNLQYDQNAELIVPALYYCQGAEAKETCADFLRILRFCVAKYSIFNEESPDKDAPEVSSEEISRRYDMQPIVVRKMGLLLQSEHDIVWGGGPMDPEWNNWKFPLKRGKNGVRSFQGEGVKTFEQYLEKRTPVQWPEHTRDPMVQNVAAYAALGSNQYHIVQGDQYNIIENSGEIKVKSPTVETTTIMHEPTKEVVSTKNERANPWMSGSFYLIGFIVVIAALSVAGKLLPIPVLPIIVIGGLIALAVIGAFQLRQDNRLSEKSFLELMALSFKYLPWLSKRNGKPDQSSTQP